MKLGGELVTARMRIVNTGQRAHTGAHRLMAMIGISRRTTSANEDRRICPVNVKHAHRSLDGIGHRLNGFKAECETLNSMGAE
jgi:hypothetical protein